MSGETAAAPAPALEIILPRLEIFCVSDQVCRFLQGDSDFRRLEFPCHQIAFVRDIAELRYNDPVFTDALAKAFDYPRSRIKAALQPRMEPPGQRGKHRLDSAERRTRNTNHNTRDPGLLYNSIPDTNHSRLGKFIHSSPPW
jgi:hypothetical protein